MTEPMEQPPIMKDGSLWGLTATQFLGAFNDNIFKQFVLLICIGGFQPVAQAIFAVPFVLGSWISGAISDRVSKRSLVIFCKILEIGVMLAAVTVLFFTSPDSDVRRNWLLVVLGFMSLQSTLFGPSKYGLLPELFRERDLPTANGIIQMTTFLAIIFGTALAGVLMARVPVGFGWVAGLVCVAIAVIGTATAFRIRETPIAEPDLVITPRSGWIDSDVWQVLRSDRLLMKVLMLTSVFWMLGSVIQQAVNGFGVLQNGWAEDATSFLLAGLSVGIAFGCLLAAKFSHGMADFPLARRAVAAMAVFSFGLAIFGEIGGSGRGAYIWLFALFTALGLATGLFAVPLQTFLQTQPPSEIKGRMVGTMNTFNFVGILLGAGVYYLCGLVFGVGEGDPISRSFIVVGLFLVPIVITLREPAEKLSSLLPGEHEEDEKPMKDSLATPVME